MADNIRIVGSILGTSQVSRYTSDDLRLITALKIKKSFNTFEDYIEYHVYDIDNQLLETNYNYRGYKLPTDFPLNPGVTSSLNTNNTTATGAEVGSISNLSTTSSTYPIVEIDPVQDLQDVGYSSGEFKVQYNIFKNKISKYPNAELFIKEISADRTELRVGSVVLTNNQDYRMEQNLKYSCENIIDNTTGVLFTTWDKFMNEDYIKIEKLLSNNKNNNKRNIFNYYIIGGEQIYKKALATDLDIKIYTTEIYPIKTQSIECDTFFPTIINASMNTTEPIDFLSNKIVITDVSPFYKSIKTDTNGNPYYYRFITYNRKNYNKIEDISFKSEEDEYLKLMRNILYSGVSNDDRTGVGTLSIFGSMLKYNLRDTFPLCTTKRMFFRAIFEELMFYLSGKTDNKILQEKNIHVWDGNTTREFLDKHGFRSNLWL